MADPIVTVTDVSVRFGEARAVDGVSLTVEPGEVLALVGESGSGKTTLLRAIQGLQRVSAGAIAFDGSSDDGRRHPAVYR